MKILKEAIQGAAQGVKSSDPATRRWSWIFWWSWTAVAVISVLGIKQLLQKIQLESLREKEIKLRIETEKREREEELKAKASPPILSLGTFTLELKEPPQVVGKKHGQNEVELEIVLQCENAELCKWFETNKDLARGELAPAFVPIHREVLLSVPGKKAFRDEIKDRLNRLKDSRGLDGNVVEVFFPRFIAT